ncbi:MAG: hypothetical protein WCL07_01655 [bacterium]
MTNIIDPKLMDAADKAFWAELNQQWAESKEEKIETRYVVLDKNNNVVKVLVTDARLVGERKIEV